MLFESLGVEKYLEEHMISTHFLTRLIKYKGLETKEAKVGLPAHTDKNILTILCENQIDGLEVQTKSGDWIKCKPSSSSFSFFALTGDSLYVIISITSLDKLATDLVTKKSLSNN